jgi:hypothetical protein
LRLTPVALSLGSLACVQAAAVKGPVVRCAFAGNSPPKPIKTGPIEIPIHEGGYVNSDNALRYQIFKRDASWPYVGMSFQVKHTDDYKSNKRTYELSIDYSNEWAYDSRFYFQLQPEQHHGPEPPVQTFYLSRQDSCSITVSGKDGLKYVDKVQMFEY